MMLAEQNLGVYKSQTPTMADVASEAMVRVLNDNQISGTPEVSRKRCISEINTLHSSHDKMAFKKMEDDYKIAKRRKKN